MEGVNSEQALPQDDQLTADYEMEPADPEDIEAMAKLIRTELEREPNTPYMKECLEKGYPSIVMRDGERMIGFVYGHRFAPDIIEVSNVLIARDYRNKDLGSRMLSQFEELASEKWKSAILVNSTLYEGVDKRPATNFYQKNGYELAHSTGETNVFVKALKADNA